MTDESISQAEIDALVKGVMGQDAVTVPAQAVPDASKLLLKTALDFIESGAQALSELVGVPCSVQLGEVLTTTALSANAMVSGHLLVGTTDLTTGLSGSISYVLPNELGLAIITQLYGGVAPSYLDESALGALSEGLMQMNQAGVSRLAGILGRPVSTGPVESVSTNSVTEGPGVISGAPVVVITAGMTVGDASGKVLVLIPQEAMSAVIEAAKVRGAAKAKPAAEPIPQGAPSGGGGMTATRSVSASPNPVPYQTAQFPDLATKSRPDDIRNIDLLMDVSLQVTVELGRTRKQIRDVLALGPGSVVELDKLAGEQVDVLVNGKLIAKGEVVVIDENYGVRITDIISPADRVQSLK